jgi:hypothetical protein
MSFSNRAKTIALAIVKIFETSKPFGDYSAVAVLDDGAGISYGTSQFTHKSGSLHAVLFRYLELKGSMPGVVLDAMGDFRHGKNILKHSNNKAIRTALKNLGKDPIMQEAQRQIAFENYLRPALKAAEGSNFTQPLSLAVIYDSLNHGSYQRIRDKVQLELPASIKPLQYEKEWIAAYVKERHEWLTETTRLRKTNYRTQFFLDQINKGNWALSLPLTVHGFKLTEQILFPNSVAVPQDSANTVAHSTTGGVPSDTPPPDFTEGERPTNPPPPPETDSGAAPGATTVDSQMSPQVLDRERPSLFTRVMTGIIMAIGTAIASVTSTCGGNEIANMAARQGAQRVIENAERSDLQTFGLVVAYIALGLGAAVLLFWIASKIWEKSSERANRLNMQKAHFAADKLGNTVEFKR